MANDDASFEPQGQATYGMANLRQKTTGLPFIVFISQKDGASHASRVKVSRAAKVRTSDLASYSIYPFRHQAGPKLKPWEEEILREWIELNERVLEDYWTGKIEYTEDVLQKISSI